MATARTEAVRSIRGTIKELNDYEAAEGIYDQIEDSEEITENDRKKLHVELSTKVNQLKQEAHDEKFAAGDKDGAESVIHPPVDPETKKLNSADDAAANAAADHLARIHKPLTVPKGCQRKIVSSDELQKLNQDNRVAACKPVLELDDKGHPIMNQKISQYEVALKSLVLAFMLFLGLSIPAFAACNWATDEAVLGDQKFCITTDGDLVPVDDATYDIGSSDSHVSNIYADQINFQTSLIANGRAGGVSTAASSSTNLAPANLPYAVLLKYVGDTGGLDETGVGTVLPNGQAGQVLTLRVVGLVGTGTWVVTPTTATGFSSLTFDAVGESATLIYLDDTYGWVLQTSTCTVTINAADLP